MKTPRALHIACLATLLFTMSIVADPAFAMNLEQAKGQGMVGEKSDGYLGSVGTQSAEVQNLIERINQERKTRYREIAEKNNTSLTAVEKLAAQKAISITPSGQYVQLPDGSWKKK